MGNWGYFTPINGVISPYILLINLLTGFPGAHLLVFLTQTDGFSPPTPEAHCLPQPMDHQNKSLNFIFPTKHVIPESLKFSHWLSEL